MKKIHVTASAVLLLFLYVFTGCSEHHNTGESLMDAFSGKFYIGTALNNKQILDKDDQAISIIKKHFNAITPENCMKSESIQPREGEFDFSLADPFVRFGEENDMFIVGHVLIWHSQAPDWFFVDEEGINVSRKILIHRMNKHIATLVGRYKGRVRGWDVVNEAILDDGSWRNNKFFEIIGEDYVRMAFEFAHDADPDAELYYNDYSMASAGRREGVINMVKRLKEQGIRIDGIGMQLHCGLDDPDINEFEKSLTAFADLGVKVMITEMDVTVLPWPDSDRGADITMNYEWQQKYNPYAQVLPDSIRTVFTDRYLQFFKLFLKHQEKVSRVTLWGVYDGQSWRNYWPIAGRTDYPLLFDRQYQPKPIVERLIEAGNGYKSEKF